LLNTLNIRDLTFDFTNKVAYFTIDKGKSLTILNYFQIYIDSLKVSKGKLVPPYYYRSDLDGKNKKKFQIQEAFYVPRELNQFQLINGNYRRCK